MQAALGDRRLEGEHMDEELLELLAPWVATGAPEPIQSAHQIAACLVLREGIALAQQCRQAAAQFRRPQLAGAQQQLG